MVRGCYGPGANDYRSLRSAQSDNETPGHSSGASLGENSLINHPTLKTKRFDL